MSCLETATGDKVSTEVTEENTCTNDIPLKNSSQTFAHEVLVHSPSLVCDDTAFDNSVHNKTASNVEEETMIPSVKNNDKQSSFVPDNISLTPHDNVLNESQISSDGCSDHQPGKSTSLPGEHYSADSCLKLESNQPSAFLQTNHCNGALRSSESDSDLELTCRVKQRHASSDTADIASTSL